MLCFHPRISTRKRTHFKARMAAILPHDENNATHQGVPIRVMLATRTRVQGNCEKMYTPDKCTAVLLP